MSEDKIVELTPDLADELKQKRLVNEIIDRIELRPVGGEIVGELNAEEKVYFGECSVLERELDDWNQELAARSSEAAGDAIRASDIPNDSAVRAQERKLFASREEAEDYYRTLYRLSYFKGIMGYIVRNRLGMFSATLSIRSGYKVCKIGDGFTP